LNQDKLYARVEDEGKGFNPDTLADPREPANQMNVGGRGVLLVKHFATRVQWNERGNVIEFEKDRG
jgi:serine/threonine-protein kinase RsbW